MINKVEGGKQFSVENQVDINKKCVQIKELYIQSTDNPEIKFNKLIHLIGSVEVLTLAYEEIQSKQGVDKKTLDGLSLENITKWSQEIRAGKYKFSPARRKYIPKPGKVEKRPLGIPSLRAKVVQKAIQRVLSAVYEPRFKDTSHGFRPGKGTHSARRYVYRKIKYPKWFIKADITKCYDKINHKKLREIRSKKISCQKTRARMKSALKAGYVDMGGRAQQAIEGTPQGSILSPLLCNIYLHELDVYMDRLKEKFDKGTKRKTSPEYGKIIRERKAVKADSTKGTHSTKKRSIKELQKKRRRTPSKRIDDPNYKKMHYVRYADDFRISVIGSAKDASELKEQIQTFLKEELHLDLNEEKTRITDSTDVAHFLGTDITRSDNTEKKVIRNKRGDKTRIGGNYRSRKAPIKKRVERLVKERLVRGNGSRTRALPRMRRVNREHPDILNYFNSKIRGIRNYYSFAANRSSLSKIVWRRWKSCARTLAKKFKRKTIKKVVDRFGKDLKHEETNIAFEKPSTLTRTNHFAPSGEVNLTIIEAKWSKKRTKSGLNKVCTICGSSPVEMHHERKIRDRKKKKHLNWIVIQMASINRKQIPLCKMHHRKLHNNTLTIEEQTLLKTNLGKRKK